MMSGVDTVWGCMVCVCVCVVRGFREEGSEGSATTVKFTVLET